MYICIFMRPMSFSESNIYNTHIYDMYICTIIYIYMYIHGPHSILCYRMLFQTFKVIIDVLH